MEGVVNYSGNTTQPSNPDRQSPTRRLMIPQTSHQALASTHTMIVPTPPHWQWAPRPRFFTFFFPSHPLRVASCPPNPFFPPPLPSPPSPLRIDRRPAGCPPPILLRCPVPRPDPRDSGGVAVAFLPGRMPRDLSRSPPPRRRRRRSPSPPRYHRGVRRACRDRSPSRGSRSPYRSSYRWWISHLLPPCHTVHTRQPPRAIWRGVPPPPPPFFFNFVMLLFVSFLVLCLVSRIIV